jgi:hypothetical protein
MFFVAQQSEFVFMFVCKLGFSNHASMAMQLDALIHPFFDELRDPNSRLPNGRFLPPLFNFKSHGMISF